MELNECSCGQLFRTAEDYRDHLPCERADIARARAQPEYQAMLANLSATQARCGVLLLALRRLRAACMGTDAGGVAEWVGALKAADNALNPVP